MAQKTDELKLFDWDASQSMLREDFRGAYFEEIAKDGDPAEIAAAIGEWAKAIGMAEIAKRAGLPVNELYDVVNAWPGDAEPLLALLNRLGVETASPRTDAAE